ncbi:unnamed protein product [Strongylus vulgaris]|uniref:RRM domain-containing protein n=1 Tax=Strongylus vulgaris TaxID=40348 RepID=A0A3P7II35_STRVU|nr:unnamed protein product [Strongylus vulgaris]
MMRGGMRGRGRGGQGRGAFPQVSSNRGDGKTLQVKKIPPELNNIAKLNEHFATFGSIVRFNGEADAALITYASRGEAMAAYKSPQPVLNNRFIKVFFYNPDIVAGATPGQDGIQRSVLNSGVNVDKPASENAPPPAQPPKVATIEMSKFVNQELKESREKIIDARRKLKVEKANQVSIFNVHKRQTDLLQKLMDRQKIVVKKVDELSSIHLVMVRNH